MNKIMRLGSLFFTFVLLGFSAMKYTAGNNKVAMYFLIAAVGFALVYISYWRKDRASK